MTEPNEIAPGAADEPSMEDLSSVDEAVLDVGVQYEGIGAGPIIAFIFISMIGIGLFIWVSLGWIKAEAQQAQADAAADLNYPDLRQVELEATQLLNKYEVINAATGTYRIPIDRAMDLVVDESYQAPSANYSQELQLLAGN